MKNKIGFLVLSLGFIVSSAQASNLASFVKSHYVCQLSRLTSEAQALKPGSLMSKSGSCQNSSDPGQPQGLGEMSVRMQSDDIGEDAVTLLGIDSSKADLVTFISFEVKDANSNEGNNSYFNRNLQKLKDEGCGLVKEKNVRLLLGTATGQMHVIIGLKASKETVLAMANKMAKQLGSDFAYKVYSDGIEVTSIGAAQFCQTSQSLNPDVQARVK